MRTSTMRVARRSIRSAAGMVVSEHAAATEIGVDVLQQGGNAVDAAVATVLALSVVEPASTGLGGGAIIVVDGPTSAVPWAIDASMTCPAEAAGSFELLDELGPSRFGWRRVRDDRNIHGPSAAAVPGLVSGLALALERFGTIGFADAITPAVALADGGVDIEWTTSLRIAAKLRQIVSDDAARAIFTKDGVPLAPVGAFVDADRLVQSDLAATMRTLARDGPASFYTGRLAATLASELEAMGSTISAQDLASFAPIEGAAISVPLGDWRLYASPGTSGGTTSLAICALIDAIRPAFLAASPAERMAMSAAASAHAFRDRRAINSGVSGLTASRSAIDPDHITGSAVHVGAKRLPAAAAGRSSGAGSTTHVSTCDRWGNVVSLTSTLADNFGAGVVVPGTGIVMNNGMQWFDPVPGSLISMGPGQRGMNNMAPVVGRRGDERGLTLGSAGGVRIIDAVAQIAVNHCLLGMPIQRSIAAPRIDASGDAILLDGRLLGRTRDALDALGMPTRVVNESVHAHQFSRPLAITLDRSTGTAESGVDPFRTSVAMGP